MRFGLSAVKTDTSVAAIIKTTQNADVEPASNAVTTDELVADLAAGPNTDLELQLDAVSITDFRQPRGTHQRRRHPKINYGDRARSCTFCMSARGGGVSIRSKKTKSQLARRFRPTHSAAGSHQVAHKFRERASPYYTRPRSYIIR